MATKFQFAGSTVRLPGVYSQIVSGRNNPPLDLDYGRLLIITDSEQCVGGAGIDGENAKGKDSIYELRTLREFQDFVGRGILWKSGEALFRPNRFDPGVSRVFIVRPFTTTSATLAFDLTSGTNGGKLTLKTLDEGDLTNGVAENIGEEDDDDDNDEFLTQGYAYTIEPGVRNSDKWILKFWLSTYRGEATDTYSFDETTKENAAPQLINESIEFDNFDDLIQWAKADKQLAKYFMIDSTNTSVKGTGDVDASEIGELDGFQLATGGTETTDKFDDMLEAIKDLDFNFVMYKHGENIEVDSNMIKLQSHIYSDAKYDKFIITGGSDNDLSESISSAEGFNSDRVVLVHGGVKKFSQVHPDGYRRWSSQIHASYICGRLAGLPPQVPITFKAIQIEGLISNLTELQREDALEAGVLVTNFDNDRGLYVVEQGINTLQDNDFTLNANSTSHVIQIKRIAAQLNKELIVNGKRALLSQPAGVNRNTLRESDVRDWTKTYLQRKVATDDVDNLILSFQDVTVERQEDAYSVTYYIDPNSEIRIVFFTGFML